MTRADLHIIGSPDCHEVAVFVHGYAVKWPSKGLFTHLADDLYGKNCLSVMFDLNNHDSKGNATFLSLSKQQEKIRAVIEIVQDDYPLKEIIVIGHSLGCGVVASMAAELKVAVSKFVLLAPAVGKPGQSIYESVMNRHGGTEDDNSVVRFKRKDGTVSSFGKSFVEEFSIDYDELYRNALPEIEDKLSIFLADNNNYTADQSKVWQDHSAVTLDYSDHNFTGMYRAQLGLCVLSALYPVNNN